jgi:hypothetical protein
VEDGKKDKTQEEERPKLLKPRGRGLSKKPHPDKSGRIISSHSTDSFPRSHYIARAWASIRPTHCHAAQWRRRQGRSAGRPHLLSIPESRAGDKGGAGRSRSQHGGTGLPLPRRKHGEWGMGSGKGEKGRGRVGGRAGRRRPPARERSNGGNWRWTEMGGTFMTTTQPWGACPPGADELQTELRCSLTYLDSLLIPI